MLTLREISESAWQHSWETGYNTTYFQSPAWFRLWGNIQGGSANAYEVYNEDSQYLGVFPVYTNTSFGVSRSSSSCAGTFGGLIQTDSNTAKLTSEQIRQLASRFTNLTWRIPPECSPNRNPDFINSDFTHRLDLTKGWDDIKTEWEKGKSGIARKNRKARDNGVSVFPAQYPEEWKEYYELYLQNTQRWNPPPSVIYPFRLFDDIRAGEKHYATLWLAYSREENLAAGALCLYSKTSCVYWNGASSADHLNLRPMNLLISTIIKDAIKRGLTFFDFNPSGGVAGVERFKESFGAVKTPAPVYDSRSGFLQFAGKIKSAVNRVRGKVSGNG